VVVASQVHNANFPPLIYRSGTVSVFNPEPTIIPTALFLPTP